MIAMSTQDGDLPPPAVNGSWVHSKRDGWTYNRNSEPVSATQQSWPDHPAVNASMAKLTASRGYLNLSQAHALAAQDCPRGCDCLGCRRTRADADEARGARQKRASKARREVA